MIKNKKNNLGFTFIEVMVALAIGITLTFMTLTIFSNNKRAYDTNNRIIEMNENIRFALLSMKADLKNAGFYGGADTISGASDFSNNDCDYGKVDDAEYISTSTETDNPVWGRSDTKKLSCLSGITSGTDYISIRGVRGNIDNDADLANKTGKSKYIYIRTGAKEGAFRDSANVPSVANSSDMNWRYYSNIYFVCENRLLRKRFYYNTDSSKTKWKLEVLSGPDLADTDPVSATCSNSDSHTQSGVEKLNFLYGIDTDNNGVSDYYAKGDDIVKSDLKKIVEIKVFLIVRSEQDLNYTDPNSYDNDGDGTNEYKPKDSYHRKQFKQTFFIRNNWYKIKNDPSNL